MNYQHKFILNIFFLYSFLCFHQFTITLMSQNYECGFQANMDSIMRDPTQMEILDIAQDNIMEDAFINGDSIMASTQIISLPVVVHVIHKGEAEGVESNITESQIYSAITGLNSDFADYDGNGTHSGIQFCLAKRDPLGNATNGITRTSGYGISIEGKGIDKMNISNFTSGLYFIKVTYENGEFDFKKVILLK